MRYTAFADIAARLESFTLAVAHVAETVRRPTPVK